MQGVKRGRTEVIVYPNKKVKTNQVVVAQRAGYSSVARTRGPMATGEMKYFDCERTLNDGALSATSTTWPTGARQDPSTTINLGSAAVASPLCLFAPTVGSALNQRIGRSVNVWKIKVKGTIQTKLELAQSEGEQPANVRVVLVQDCQTNSTQMAPADLFGPAGSAASTLQVFQNVNNFGRFRVLKDKFISIADANMTGSPTSGDLTRNGKLINFKINIKFRKPIVVHFNATNGGTVADIVDNSFHIICAASDIGQQPTITYYSRVCYKE